MAKTKPSHRASSKSSTLLHAPKPPRHRKSKPPPSPSTLIAEASTLLVSSSPSEALPLALRAESLIRSSNSAAKHALLPALNLLAQIHLDLGDGDVARDYFLKAVELDPEGEIAEGEGGGAEKFLWLSQLSEEGGRESVEWFERGCEVLRKHINILEKDILESPSTDEERDTQVDADLQEKKRKLAEALCGVVEIYMTDLSLEPDAEEQCERLIAEALIVAPNSPEPLQTLASVRISQLKTEEARAALSKSLSLWKDDNLGDEGSLTPDFPTRISLARLLMEVSMLDEALMVLERLVREDDQSVEAWYLGGWCLYLSAETTLKENVEERSSSLRSGRRWLKESLRLYKVLEYEDDRLQDHAAELVTDLDQELGQEDDDESQEDGLEGEWEDDEESGIEHRDDGDQEMEGT
ncbi:assembly chaperone of rpl4 [Physcia stellaris]|nr:assembly chaperone of rpl4 [Physcia stellaris]